MKTIIENSTTLSKYIVSDDTIIIISEKSISFNNTVTTSLNSNNATILYNVNPPDDWYSNKYFCINGSFIFNHNWNSTTTTTVK